MYLTIKPSRAEIYQIFLVIFWKIDDFLNTFWHYLTFKTFIFNKSRSSTYCECEPHYISHTFIPRMALLPFCNLGQKCQSLVSLYSRKRAKDKIDTADNFQDLNLGFHILKVSKYWKQFMFSSIFRKNKGKQLILRFHNSKVDFFCLFLGELRRP